MEIKFAVEIFIHFIFVCMQKMQINGKSLTFYYENEDNIVVW